MLRARRAVSAILIKPRRAFPTKCAFAFSLTLSGIPDQGAQQLPLVGPSRSRRTAPSARRASRWRHTVKLRLVGSSRQREMHAYSSCRQVLHPELGSEWGTCRNKSNILTCELFRTGSGGSHSAYCHHCWLNVRLGLLYPSPLPVGILYVCLSSNYTLAFSLCELY
jgi:hypothetical protein